MPNKTETYVNEGLARDWCLRVMEKVGLPPQDALIFIDALLHANLRGDDTHGLNYLPNYIRRLEEGLVARDGDMIAKQQGDCYAVLDGANKLGQVAATQGMRLAINKALETGVGVVLVKNSNHCGALSYYTMMALESECIGMGASNAYPTMSPLGGMLPFFGTNPFSIAVPAGKEEPFILDMSTSAQARAKVISAARKGEKIPLGWALDKEGHPTDDPEKAATGTMLPMAGHKGFGIAMAIDILCGILSGSASSREIGGFLFKDGASRQNIGQYFQAIRIDKFIPLENFKNKVDWLIRELRNTNPVNGVEKIYIPGDGSRLQLKIRSRNGIPLNEYVKKGLEEIADRYGLPFPFTHQ